MSHNTEGIRHAYKAKNNFNREKQIIPLMITDGKKLHYLPVKIFHALLRRITSNNNVDFYCLNRLHSFMTKNNCIKGYVKIMIIVAYKCLKKTIKY